MVVVMPEHAKDQIGIGEGSWFILNFTRFHQVFVVNLNGIFDDGGKGSGLIIVLTELLNRRDHLHDFCTQANAELLRNIRKIVCHFFLGCWLGEFDRESR